jgi:hypothetical protein
VIVPDTSAWVELFRGTGSKTHAAMHRLLSQGEELAVTEIIVAEVLAGERSDRQLAFARRQLLGFPVLRLGGLQAFEQAAAIYRTCRAAGETLRGLADCLIAVPAIRAGAAVLHADRDFDVIARHTDLRIEPAG